MRSVVPYAPPQPFSIRPDLVDPSGDIAVWFTDPPGVIFQFTRPLHSTIEHAEWVTGAGLRAVVDRFPDTTRFVTIHDFRLMTSRDLAGRTLLLERTRARKEQFAQSYVLLPENAGPIFVTSCHAAVTLLRVMGVPVQIASSLSDAIQTAALRPAIRAAL